MKKKKSKTLSKNQVKGKANKLYEDSKSGGMHDKSVWALFFLSHNIVTVKKSEKTVSKHACILKVFYAWKWNPKTEVNPHYAKAAPIILLYPAGNE